MEASFKSIILFAAVILTGLSAGLFFAWSISVIPGTQKVLDTTYLHTMQSINRAILNPLFFLVFFGSLLCLSIASIFEFHSSKLVFGLILTSSIFYLAGTVGVTALGNVPLNNQLDALNLSQLSMESLAAFRKYYETKWNRLHQIRTAFAVVAYILSVLAVFIQAK